MHTFKRTESGVPIYRDEEVLTHLEDISTEDLKDILAYDCYMNGEAHYIYDERDAIVGSHPYEPTAVEICIDAELKRRGVKLVPDPEPTPVINPDDIPF